MRVVSFKCLFLHSYNTYVHKIISIIIHNYLPLVSSQFYRKYFHSSLNAEEVEEEMKMAECYSSHESDYPMIPIAMYNV